MTKRLLSVCPVVLVLCGVVQAGLSGLPDINVVDDAIVDLTYSGTTYNVANGDLITGTTTRWYVLDSVETLWPDGDPAPAGTPTVGGTSTPKEDDIGANADDFLFRLDDANHMSSIDGIDFQETRFDNPTDTFFMFERGGNDAGSIQAILLDGSLGPEMAFIKGTDGGPYADTGVNVGGQNAWGLVITTDVPVSGFRLNASGHDALSISTVIPEPGTMVLLSLGGLLLLRFRK